MLTQRRIFWFWLPLAFSFLLMIFEGPWIQGVISRQPDAAIQLAAFGVVIGMAVLIETPVITFLAVGSALASDKQSYEKLSQYVWILNIGLTIVHLLFAFTPVLDFYLGTILDIPPELIAETRTPMVIMILWTGLIGYRRFHQGILINADMTRTITTGTFIRIVASAGVAFGLGIWTDVKGAEIGAWSLMAAVTVELIYVYIISRPVVAKLKSKPQSRDRDPLTLAKVTRFHMPLAITALISWFILPLTQRALAQADNAVEVLAAYPVIFSIMMIGRAGGIAWQEAVITLNKGEAQRRALQTFTLRLGIGTSLLILIFAVTPLVDIYTGSILGIPENLIPLVRTGVVFATLMPFLSTGQSYLRALLIGKDDTNPIYQAMIVGFIVTITALFGGIQMGLPAIPVALIALSAGVIVELLYLWRALQRLNQQAMTPQIVEAI
ncbi:MAG: hypothetical protein AAFV93_16375 [Chloroflexota bacterium]